MYIIYIYMCVWITVTRVWSDHWSMAINHLWQILKDGNQPTNNGWYRESPQLLQRPRGRIHIWFEGRWITPETMALENSFVAFCCWSYRWVKWINMSSPSVSPLRSASCRFLPSEWTPKGPKTWRALTLSSESLELPGKKLTLGFSWREIAPSNSLRATKQLENLCQHIWTYVYV